MLQITYLSTARPELPARAIDDILLLSRRNNQTADVTGLLLYDGYHFLQAIEGEAMAVQAAFERVKADSRHRALVRLSSRMVAVRAFGGWAMAGQRVGIAGSATVAELVDQLTEEIADPDMRALLRSFARLRSAA